MAQKRTKKPPGRHTIRAKRLRRSKNLKLNALKDQLVDESPDLLYPVQEFTFPPKKTRKSPVIPRNITGKLIKLPFFPEEFLFIYI